MQKKHIWLTIVIILVLVGVSIFFEERPQLDPQEEADRQTKELVKEIAQDFLNNFIAFASPSEDPDASKKLLKVLSEDALLEIDEENLSRDFALFVGVQDVPDMGFEMGDVSLEIGNRAIVKTKLKYSGGSTLRNIHLLLEDEMWKVDSITQPIKEEVFLEKGNLIINNPGFPEGIWHLVYEKEGSPALNTALSFNEYSLCIVEEEEIDCEPEFFKAGASVEVKGVENNGTVEVLRLQLL